MATASKKDLRIQKSVRLTKGEWREAVGAARVANAARDTDAPAVTPSELIRRGGLRLIREINAQHQAAVAPQPADAGV